MNKICLCGLPMDIHQSTIIYKRKLRIEHVPIWNCEKCRNSELHAFLKEEVLFLIHESENHVAKQVIQFDEWSENAKIFYRLFDDEIHLDSLKNIVDQRINELLDEWILVNSLHDENWLTDIRRRLLQLTKASSY